ncbi:phytanoyl-CoA dioxygenase family protein [Achromobacter sp. ES-001]|uniref:phytanoyl-CoA dioxygenase family protein n=1 Tax=Achromobacter sp. ES-001 TaxID=2860286 RepID=UPI001C63F6FE|nr:phytanoyl-CoA dioxygenase family protein [Achromobacter sp. ES-001]QYJ21117.1 phytanoyl-CoA dioxygenase family protein [Achromobacter sp. ES-001]
MSGFLHDDQIAVLRQQGFVVARQFADPHRVAALRALAERHLQDHVAPIEYEADLRYPGAPASREAQGGLTVRRLLNAYARDPLFAQWATDPAIGQWLARYFGEPAVLSTVHHNCVMTKHPAYGSLTGWHQDIRYWSFSDTDLVSCWLALVPESSGNGGLSFIPGSHTASFAPEQFDEKKFFRENVPQNADWIARAVSPTLEAGDVVFFHCRTLHAAPGNRSDRVKLSLVHTYHPASCHPIAGTRSASQPDVPLAG